LFSRSEPLALPYSAKQIASNIVVFPAPVLPEITNKRFPFKSSKSIFSLSLYASNAVIIFFIGFMFLQLLLLLVYHFSISYFTNFLSVYCLYILDFYLCS